MDKSSIGKTYQFLHEGWNDGGNSFLSVALLDGLGS